MLAAVLLTEHNRYGVREQVRTVSMIFAVLLVNYVLMLMAGRLCQCAIAAIAKSCPSGRITEIDQTPREIKLKLSPATRPARTGSGS